MRISVPCPAKVNLFLSVGPPDEHKFHPIRTVFQAVGLFDVLTIETGVTEDRITCSWPDLPEENTVAKALRLAREILPIPPLQVHIEKNIPALTGLGGGSSDAAGLLRSLDRFLATPAPQPFLNDVAAAVGKDVPFFLVGGRARGEGYGEILTPLEDPEPVWFVIVKPRVGCSTKEAYARLDGMVREFADFDSEAGLYNDFERVAPCESLEFIEVLLAYGAEGSLLCGSGSGVFGIFREEAVAQQALYRLSQDSRIETWVAPSLTRAESLSIKAAYG